MTRQCPVPTGARKGPDRFALQSRGERFFFSKILLRAVNFLVVGGQGRCLTVPLTLIQIRHRLTLDGLYSKIGS
jgi:hypothetical protein